MAASIVRILFLAAALLAAIPALCQGGEADVPTCPSQRIEPERLPDLTLPRCSHTIFFLNGELTLAGGHTTNFVPTQTAEYYADGEWHLMPMAYTHDNGFAVVCSDDQAIIGGGHSEELGIGQTYTLERYTQSTHTFEGFGCLDRRRALSGATLLADGRVIISGNHYGGDAIACFDGRSQVQYVKDVAQGRDNPYVLPMADDDVLIIGKQDSYGQLFDTVWADRLKGDAFRVPLLEQWHIVFTDQPFSSRISFIGNEREGDYSYLLTVADANGQFAIAHVRKRPGYQTPTFSLLPTATPIPMQTQWGPIRYMGPVIADRTRRRGYVVGVDSLCRRQFILGIDYGRSPAPLTLYYTDTLEHSTVTIPVLTHDGDLILAGGSPDNNYRPLATVWRYRLATSPLTATAASGWPAWLWALLALAGCMALAYTIIYLYRRKPANAGADMTGGSGPSEEDSVPSDEELLMRVCQFIEQDQRYLQSRLRLTDVALELGVSVGAVTDCLAARRGITFAQLIAEYRVHHAQQLLREQPDMKIVALISQSGFTSESTFFRTFKTVTGLSPKEWLAQLPEGPAST